MSCLSSISFSSGLHVYLQTKLFVLSDPPIASVFSDERRPTGEITPHMRAMMDDLGLSAETVGSSSIFTGDEEVFAFARAVVRPTCRVSSPTGHLRLSQLSADLSFFAPLARVYGNRGLQSRITEMSSKQWAQLPSVKNDQGEGLTADQIHESGEKVATA